MTQLGRDADHHVVAVPGDRRLVLSWAALTDTGLRRTANEDSLTADAPLFAVADGMGGHAAGDRASDAVVTRLARAAHDEFADLGDVFHALEQATADIDLVADERHLGVGTTVTGAALVLHDDEPFFAVFNIGDSRVYCFLDGELTQITVDHSVVQELVDAGALHPDDAEFHPDNNVITRAVGFSSAPEPDSWLVRPRAGMRLLVCSDGLTKEVGRERIRLHLDAGNPPVETAASLVDAALAAGGRDNVTVIVVDVVETPAAAA